MCGRVIRDASLSVVIGAGLRRLNLSPWVACVYGPGKKLLDLQLGPVDSLLLILLVSTNNRWKPMLRSCQTAKTGQEFL